MPGEGFSSKVCKKKHKKGIFVSEFSFVEVEDMRVSYCLFTTVVQQKRQV